jgi:gluconolactonase
VIDGVGSGRTRVQAAATVSFLEGPACGPGRVIYFSDIPASRIYSLAPDGGVSVFREDSGRANGNVFDRDGRLITCEGGEFGTGGRRRVTRTDPSTGAYEVVTDRFDGVRYNGPNDVTVDAAGRIYFTDPRFGRRHEMKMSEEAVYRVDPDGRVQRIVSQPRIQRPNGIAVSADGGTLYVVDSNYDPGGNRCIWAFALDGDGNLDPGPGRLVFSWAPGRGADGIELDEDGNIWAAGGIRQGRSPGETGLHPPGVYVLRPDGALLDMIPMPQDVVTNLCFGGPDFRTLFVTAGNTLFQVPVEVRGYHVYAPEPTVEASAR